MVVDLPVAEEVEEAIDLVVGDRAAQAYSIDVVDGHEHRRLIRDHAQVVKTAGGSEDCFGFDALNDAESVVRVNDLVTDLKCHMSPN